MRRELGWIISLLPLLFADARRPWHPHLYAADASGRERVFFGGFGVCRRRVPVDTIRKVGQVNESWRFDADDFVAARRQALDEARQLAISNLMMGTPLAERVADPAPSLGEVQVRELTEPLGGVDDLALAVERGRFEAVPVELVANFSDWYPVVSGRWLREVPIIRGEGRALICAVRHALRSREAHGRRMLVLSDNLGLTLAIAKGRGKTASVNQTCRELAALSMLTNCKVVVRWVPSELNPSDGPSRGARWTGGLAPALQSHAAGAEAAGPSHSGKVASQAAAWGSSGGRYLAALDDALTSAAGEEEEAGRRRGRFRSPATGGAQTGREESGRRPRQCRRDDVARPAEPASPSAETKGCARAGGEARAPRGDHLLGGQHREARDVRAVRTRGGSV